MSRDTFSGFTLTQTLTRERALEEVAWWVGHVCKNNLKKLGNYRWGRNVSV